MRLICPPPLVALILAFAMWLLHRQTAGLAVAFPFQVHFAAVLAIIGLALDLNALRRFLKARTTISPFRPNRTERLVTGGVYRLTRNPMYLGMLLLLSAWAVWLGNPLNLAALAAYVAFITQFQIKPEERALAKKFGQPYLDYCARVRRWL